eukprot:scaffold3836_cov417-Prasinococcus_capsulatus_cf.AAC.16
MRNWPGYGHVDASDEEHELAEPITLDYLANAYGADTVIANDRAPARHADEHVERVKQRSVSAHPQTISLLLRVVLKPESLTAVDATDYLKARPERLDGEEHEEARQRVPFYLNGWRAFKDHVTSPTPCTLAEELQARMPTPYFTTAIDDNEKILREVGNFLKAKLPALGPTLSSWMPKMSRSLSKLFIGPVGTITRLHYDSGSPGRGWLETCEAA